MDPALIKGMPAQRRRPLADDRTPEIRRISTASPVSRPLRIKALAAYRLLIDHRRCMLPTGILALLLSSSPQAQILESARFGSLDADVGALSILHQYDGATDKGLGAAFLQLRYRSPELAGARLGAWWLGLRQLGESHPGDYDALCETSQALRELHVTLPLPGSLKSSRLQIGRFDMRSTAMDGNSHQGIAWQFESDTDLRLEVGLIERWAKYNRIHLNFQGLTEWGDISDVHPQAGDQFWFTQLRIPFGETGMVEPFLRYQDRVMLVSGLNWDLGRSMPAGARIGLDGTLAHYGNRWPRALKPDYQDVFSWLVHGYRQFGSLRVGIGWHGVNDRRGNLGAGLFYWIDPLMVDETIPYDDRNAAQLFYADAKLKRDRLDLTLRYGYGVNRAIDLDSHEIDILTYYNLTPSLTWGWLVAINVYSGDLLPDYTRIGTILSYAF